MALFDIGIGYITNYDPRTQSVSIKSFTGEIIDNVPLDNPGHLQWAPLVRPINSTTGTFVENQFGAVVLFLQMGDYWRKIIHVWNNAPVGQNSLFPSSADQITQINSDPASATRKPRQLPGGEVCVSATTQLGTGNLGGCLYLNQRGDVSLKTGGRSASFDLTNNLSSATLNTSQYELKGTILSGVGTTSIKSTELGVLTLAQLAGKISAAQTTVSSINLTPDGAINIQNLKGSITLATDGTITATNTGSGTVTMDPTGNIAITGGTVAITTKTGATVELSDSGINIDAGSSSAGIPNLVNIAGSFPALYSLDPSATTITDVTEIGVSKLVTVG